MVTYRYNRKLATCISEYIACLVKKCNIEEKFAKSEFLKQHFKKSLGRYFESSSLRHRSPYIFVGVGGLVNCIGNK